jgi:hypothetical protein
MPCRLSDPDLAPHHVSFISKQQESFAGPLAPALDVRFKCGAIRDNFKNVAACHLVCLGQHFEGGHGALEAFAIK